MLQHWRKASELHRCLAFFYREAAAGIRYCQRKAGWHHQSDIISAAQLLNVAWRNVQGDPMKWVRTFSHLSSNKNKVENMNNIVDRWHIVIYSSRQHTNYNNKSFIAGCCFEALRRCHSHDAATRQMWLCTGAYSNCYDWFKFPIKKSHGYI